MIIIKSFFKVASNNKLWTTLLFLGSIFGHLISLLIPIFASNIVLHITNNNSNLAYLNILYLAITYVFYNLFWYLNYLSFSYNFAYSYKKLREKIIDKIFTYDASFTNKISKGTIINTMGGDVSHVSVLIDNICEMIVVFAKIIILLIVFIFTNIYICLFVIVINLIYIKFYDYCNIKTSKYLLSQTKYRDKLTDNVSEILNGHNEIKMFNIFDKMKNNFNIIADKWTDQYLKKRIYVNLENSLIPFIIHFGKVILYLILAYLTLNGHYEINVLILLIAYFEEVMGNTRDFMKYSGEIRNWGVSIKRINAILNYSSTEQIEFGINENDYITGLVEFKKVNFSYKNENKGSIQNISFSAQPNNITALVGHSGSGKTTIINLILRKYKINKGSIKIDNDDIYSYSKNIYSKNVIAVNQSTIFFNMSISKNLGLIDKNRNNQIAACKRVGIHDYIMSLPKGYNTILSDNANNLSGGQRQLLSIARVLLSKAEILIFDEVTSSLDTLLVDKIKSLFEDLKQDHTIIIISHKKDVMSIADKIVVLNKGKIVGMGTHDELIKDNDYYIDLQTNIYSSPVKDIGA